LSTVDLRRPNLVLVQLDERHFSFDESLRTDIGGIRRTA
jgi:hypothetical protein